MSLLDRVITNVHACGIELAFQGEASPSHIEGWQPFYNSIFEGATFEKAYASMSSIFFEEQSVSSPSGPLYTQKATFRFPENDKFRAERIALIHQIKFVKFKFTNRLDLVIGRNDITTNSTPTIKVSSDGQLCQVELETKSIAPAGFTPNINAFGLPTFVPLSLI
jgi:hypothetical protein